jgi:uncharacterized tellurite resistance protein B-like protein
MLTLNCSSGGLQLFQRRGIKGTTMIKKLFNQLAASIQNPDSPEANAEQHDAALRMATAVLLIDVARADNEFDEIEFEHLLELIESHFELTPQQSAELLNSASDKAEDLVSLHEFTRILNQHLDDKEKTRIVSFLWQIAYVDGRLDKFEDALVLKIADLLYVNRTRVMRLKHDAQQQLD